MKQNEGTADRVIRLIIGLGLAGTGVALKLTGAVGGWVPVIIIILGAVALFTAATGVCLIYLPFGITTRAKK
ncbi:MAG: DUF2892 domain-containing protein [Spirochaetes bacterium]|nr:DUF2892 domain-containing protein [Spirochaetota bacterium]